MYIHKCLHVHKKPHTQLNYDRREISTLGSLNHHLFLRPRNTSLLPSGPSHTQRMLKRLWKPVVGTAVLVALGVFLVATWVRARRRT